MPAAVPSLLPGLLALAAAVLLLKLSISGAALESAVASAASAEGEEARARTDLLVSRDATDLSEGHLHSALLETLSENTTDSLLTPLLYYGLLGLPGALAYRALDTVDSMLGYPSRGRLGLVPARAEDAATALPALIALLPLSLAAAALRGPRAAANGLRAARTHRHDRAGYNGKVMAFYAGALGVTLEKPGAYAMGTGPLPAPSDVRSGVTLFRAAALFTLPLVIGAIHLKEVVT